MYAAEIPHACFGMFTPLCHTVTRGSVNGVWLTSASWHCNGGEKGTSAKMIHLHEFKKLLGADASDLSDAEIERIRDLEYRLADIVFDAWLRKRNSTPEIAEASET
jgi:hypothetical protein